MTGDSSLADFSFTQSKLPASNIFWAGKDESSNGLPSPLASVSVSSWE